MTLQHHVVLFARAPRLGRGKRRLAREVGDVRAWRFHRLNTGRVLRRLAGDRRWTTWLAVTPDRAALDRRGLWDLPVRVIPQGAGDLGRRMARPMHRLPPGPVVIVGADIPDIQPRHLAQAFRLLGRHDAVIGPADDGGYWLIGLRRRPCVRPPFAGVRWGSAHALDDTLANLARQGDSVGFLEVLGDVDTAADLRPHHFR